jgi:hypothetical protein
MHWSAATADLLLRTLQVKGFGQKRLFSFEHLLFFWLRNRVLAYPLPARQPRAMTPLKDEKIAQVEVGLPEQI